MKVGFNKRNLVGTVWAYESDDLCHIEEAASDFAEKEHEINDCWDMKFKVYVEDDSGKIHEAKFYTEYDPRFEVDSVTELSGDKE